MATVTVLLPAGTAHSGREDDVPVDGSGLTPPSWVVEVVDVDGEIVVGGPGRIVGEGSVVLVLEVVVVSGAAASALSAALPGLAFAPLLGAAPESVADALICAPLIGRAT